MHASAVVAATADPAAGIGLLAALGAGLASFLSPCVLPLVPGYLSTVVGVVPGDFERTPRLRVLGPSLLFIASFSTIFVLCGLGATAVGSTLEGNRLLLERIGAGFIIAFGAVYLLSPFVGALNRTWHLDGLLRRTRSGGPIVAGAAFALAWTPCTSFTLGAILTAGGLSGSAGHGALLLAVYSAGLGIPLLLTALAFDEMSRVFALVKRHYTVVIAAGGAILIAMGVLILTGDYYVLNSEANRLFQGNLF